MGNAVSMKDFDERELGEAHLDSSSPKVIESKCVSHDQLRLIQKNKKWYSVSKHDGKEEFLFGFQKQRQFAGMTQVLVDDKNKTIAVLQTTRNGRGIKTLIYRPTETFEGQQPTMELYKEKELKKKPDLPKLYLFARIQTSAASKCDANYALLQVHIVYNDPDFARFQDPPLYRAAKVSGGGRNFAAAVMDGTDHGGKTLLAKVTSTEAEVANGVDIIATICLAYTVNQSGASARGVEDSDVV